MKKTGIIIAGVAVAILGIAIFFILPIISSQDLSKYIPKNALYVMKLDIGQMAGKLDMEEIQELKFFRKEVLGELRSSQKDMAESLMSNPLNAGIQFRTSPTYFIFDNSNNDGELVGALMIGISDGKKFKSFISDLSKDISVKDPGDDGFYEISDDNSDEVKIYFNDDIAMLLIDMNRNDLSFKKVRDKLLNLDKSNSILSNETYTSINNESNDVLSFLNKKELKKALENDNFNYSFSRSDMEALSFLPAGMTLNFKEDAISLKAYQEADEKNKLTKENGLEEIDLKNISLNGKPFAFMSMNIDLVNAIETILDNLGEREKNDFESSMNQIAETIGTDKEEIYKAFKGKMSIAYAGIVRQTKADTFSYDTLINSFPKIYFWAKLDKKQVVNSILNKIVENGEGTVNDGIYILNEYNYYDPTIYIAIKEDDLFITTDLNGINAKLKNNSWQTLTDANAKDLATSKPVAAFVDLNYKNYEDYIINNMSSSETQLFDKLKKNVLQSFKNISLSGTEQETELSLQMSEEKKNSLHRLILLMDEAYRISN